MTRSDIEKSGQTVIFYQVSVHLDLYYLYMYGEQDLDQIIKGS